MIESTKSPQKSPPEDRLVGLVSRLNRRVGIFRHTYRGGEYIRLHAWTVTVDGAYEERSAHQFRVSIHLLRPLIRVLRIALHMLEQDGLL